MHDVFLGIFIIGFVYSHIIYPAVLLVLCAVSRRSYDVEAIDLKEVGSVTLIVAVFNEENGVRAKIEDCIKLKQPGLNLEIIVASDCSNDATDKIVLEYAHEGVSLVRANERKGKEYAQQLAIQRSKGKVLVFSDVATRIPLSSYNRMLAYFSDDKIGAISSRDKIINIDGRVSSEGSYVKYEMWVRALESKLAGVVGLSGSFFAIRKELATPWDTLTCSDFQCAINAASSGYLAIGAPDVFGHYPSLKSSSDEYARRVRTVLRGMSGLSKHRKRMLSLKQPLFAFQVFSHKVMRWLSPWFFILLFFTILPVWWESPIYILIFLVQVMILLIYALSKVFPDLLKNRHLGMVAFFVESNIAVVDAGLNFIGGRSIRIWEPSKR